MLKGIMSANSTEENPQSPSAPGLPAVPNRESHWMRTKPEGPQPGFSLHAALCEEPIPTCPVVGDQENAGERPQGTAPVKPALQAQQCTPTACSHQGSQPAARCFGPHSWVGKKGPGLLWSQQLRSARFPRLSSELFEALEVHVKEKGSRSGLTQAIPQQSGVSPELSTTASPRAGLLLA